MDRELWNRVKGIAADAWEQPAPERAAYVGRVCGGDAELAREILSLLSAMEDAGGRFETPAVAMADAHLAAAEAIDTVDAGWVGQRIGPWTLVRELGHGGMGTVYLAERADAEFTQRAAVKVVRGGAFDRQLVERFRGERRILASLEHPHIARLIDGGATALGVPYVVMEYVDGVPIDVFCERHGLDVRRRIELVRRVCEAVQYAHQRLIVHRDIKPSNILVTADGVPKLLDFGIAKILDTARPADTTLFRMVTPESASPEQIRGEPITTAADVYALGVLLYRLLTNRSPYRLASSSEPELIRAVCEQVPDPPSAIAPSIDPDLDRIVLMALRKEPERRYGGADHFSEDLQRYLDGRPVAAAPDSRWYRVRKLVVRHRLATGAAAALVVAIAGGSAATMWQARVARRERVRAERQFNTVRTLASSVLGELHDSVARLPGSTAARELLLRRATEYLDGLSREAGTDAALRRELVAGYQRLAQIQGDAGNSNVGNPEAALASQRKALALIEPIASETRDVRDRLILARTYVDLAPFEKDAATRRSYSEKALAILEAIPPAERTSREGHDAAVAIWYDIGRQRTDAHDYAGAKAAFSNVAQEAEAELRLAPGDAHAVRGLSIAFKQLGTSVHMLEHFDEAIGYYRRALALDRQLSEQTNGSVESRLDLSYSYGAIGGALIDKQDVDGAREYYTRAVELRRAVAAEDPTNDRAVLSVALGYRQLAKIARLAGDVSGAFDSQDARLKVMRDRAAAHPDRDALWHAYADTLLDAANECDDLLESQPVPAGTRARFARRIDVMLKDLVALRARWTREQHPASLRPSDADLQRALERTHRLLAR